jgi:hypothetical protein
VLDRVGKNTNPAMEVKREFHFSIDRGGTFTDVFAQVRGLRVWGCNCYCCTAQLQHSPDLASNLLLLKRWIVS